jgi:hypothetical protein
MSSASRGRKTTASQMWPANRGCSVSPRRCGRSNRAAKSMSPANRLWSPPALKNVTAVLIRWRNHRICMQPGTRRGGEMRVLSLPLSQRDPWDWNHLTIIRCTPWSESDKRDQTGPKRWTRGSARRMHIVRTSDVTSLSDWNEVNCRIDFANTIDDKLAPKSRVHSLYS